MNIPPIPTWLNHYFAIPTDRYVSVEEAQSLMAIAKVSAHRYINLFFKSRLVERKRVLAASGRTVWVYRRVLIRIVYDENVLNRVEEVE